MLFREVSAMAEKLEFVLLAEQEGSNVRDLCRRYRITAPTAYKWLARHLSKGAAGLEERSRKPLSCPWRTDDAMEQRVLSIRDHHPAWGARKIKARLMKLGVEDLPSSTTIQAILHRHHRIDPAESLKRQAFQRFEHPEPNDLWQMDFKGYISTPQGRCYPLTILDDHSRFSLGVHACAAERGSIVQAKLTSVFRRYGLPLRFTVDNGSPWGTDADRQYTALTAWLIRLGIRVSHSRPYHPQTQGKDERFHRTLKAELLRARSFASLAEADTAFEQWRQMYNLERPHEAIGMEVPATRYRISERAFPEALPAIEYDSSDVIRTVDQKGHISYKGGRFLISKAFRGLKVALRPTTAEGVLSIYFCQQQVREIDLKDPSNV